MAGSLPYSTSSSITGYGSICTECVLGGRERKGATAIVCVIGVEVQSSVSAAPVKSKARNAAEEEYLAKLQAIRRQNYMERKRIQDKAHVAVLRDNDRGSPTGHAPTPAEEMELNARRKKIAALKVESLAVFGFSMDCGIGRHRQTSRRST